MCDRISGIVFLNGSQNKWKRNLYGILILAAGGLLYRYGEGLLIWSASKMLDRGISSRTIEMILSGGIRDDSGRETIYKIAVAAIKENPLRGYGAYGDRPIIGRYYYWGYCHNIAYEMAIDFGVIAAGLLLAIILYRSLKLIFAAADRQIVYLYLIVFSMNMRLLVSDTFWGNRFFWMALALLFMYRKNDISKSRRERVKNGSSHFRFRFNVHRGHL